jgi:hypothetical protein
MFSMSRDEMRGFLDRHAALLPKRVQRIGKPPKWPVEVVETIRAIQGRSYEQADPQSDWLARYLKEGPHGSNRARPTRDR